MQKPGLLFFSTDYLFMDENFDLENHIFRSPAFQKLIEESITFFQETPVQPLPPKKQFNGTGIYGLYLSGNHPIYQAIADQNREKFILPIYIGKAVPAGWRQGRITDNNSPALYARLREHYRSIEQGENLILSDFSCRFMVLNNQESNLIGTVEAALIRLYKPLWNSVIDGFGNHDPGKGRYEQAKSEWDVIHPGRNWAKRLRGQSPNIYDILIKIDNYCTSLK